MKINKTRLFLFIVSLIILIIFFKDCLTPKVDYAEFYKIPLDFYIVNDLINTSDLDKDLNYVNNELNKYGINFYINNITFINNLTYSPEKNNLLFETNNYTIFNDTIGNMISHKKLYDKRIDVIYLNETSDIAGRGKLYDFNFILVSDEIGIRGSYRAWDLLHELTHILGVSHYDLYFSLNLINDKGDLGKISKSLFKPTCLNREQMRTIINGAEALSVQ